MHQYDFSLVTRTRGNDTWNDFLATLNAFLVMPTPDGPWLCGGSIRRLVNGEPQDSDFDYFFKNENQATLFEQAMRAKGAVLVRETETNKTWQVFKISTEIGQLAEPILVQQITFLYYQSIQEVLDTFDFTICQFGFDGEHLYTGPYSLYDTARKRLALHRLTYGVSTVRRLLKYSKQGYTACSGVLTDILQRTIETPATVNPKIISLD